MARSLPLKVGAVGSSGVPICSLLLPATGLILTGLISTLPVLVLYMFVPTLAHKPPPLPFVNESHEEPLYPRKSDPFHEIMPVTAVAGAAPTLTAPEK